MIVGRHKKGRIGKQCFHEPEYDGQECYIYGEPKINSNCNCAIVQTLDGKLHVWSLNCLELGKHYD